MSRSSDLQYLPVPKIEMPVVSSIEGVVIETNDPQGWGRVRVDFPFTRRRYCGAWIRVMSPNAGSSSDVATNRGFVFIPEKGDRVMVGFEYGDPNRPYVMGSLFHGKNAAGGGTNNAIKSLITRSGIKIVFNDEQKSLHIEDPSGTTFDMDGDGNVAVNAPETITMNAKNININAAENINTNAGKNNTLNVGKDNSISVGQSSTVNVGTQYSLFAGDITEMATGCRNSKSAKITEDAQNRQLNSREDSTLHTQGRFNNNSGEKSNFF